MAAHSPNSLGKANALHGNKVVSTLSTKPIIEIKDLRKSYEIKTGFRESKTLKALDGVSFALEPRTTLGIVGESGCGKSTLAKVIQQIVPPTSGDIFLNGTSFREVPQNDYRKKVQMIFQDPYRSLNPRKKAVDIIAEPMLINTDKSKEECREHAIQIMEKVGLRSDYAQRYPHMFSGGQRQRIGIARALIMKPEVVICDEPVSALDVSIQAQVLNLLMDLQNEFGLTYLFISHDLSVVRHLVDNVAVMYLGKIVEYGTRDKIFFDPKHPYTQALLASTPQILKENRKPQAQIVRGELPSLINPPQGCSFHSRCPLAIDQCRSVVPSLDEKQNRKVACHLV